MTLSASAWIDRLSVGGIKKTGVDQTLWSATSATSATLAAIAIYGDNGSRCDDDGTDGIAPDETDGKTQGETMSDEILAKLDELKAGQDALRADLHLGLGRLESKIETIAEDVLAVRKELVAVQETLAPRDRDPRAASQLSQEPGVKLRPRRERIFSASSALRNPRHTPVCLWFRALIVPRRLTKNLSPLVRMRRLRLTFTPVS